ncbi:transmembrane protein, putative (macronuclear) [Tetrahymena thermophila SB210]|uniref:Transmembrane protein, putative n=1 Tax=Tetrahymena thermophila (strain SB210) TaxID=312017 RepID=I7MFW9_TETTS|nr:transmembrane protein, putative [Tetrahymena thermophila SB210]EAR84450.2 transmembrane protein, putative [Tetrahymena thermophila SB210]|eukprot:XP_001032113.2 transmembrane protein, putative [Tetrahymena thermophila SB210]
MQKETIQLIKRGERLDRKQFILLRKNYSNNYLDNIIYPVDLFDSNSGLIVIKYNTLTEIELIECRIDIHLLKDIIQHSLQNLINISLIYCTFYSIEKPFMGETFEQERHLADFLNLINFVSLIRSFQFQQIKNIVFKPLKYSSVFQYQIKKPIDYDEKNRSNFTIYNNKKGEQLLPISIKKYDGKLEQPINSIKRQIEVTPELKKQIAQKVKALDTSQYVQNEIELKQFEISNMNSQGQFDVEDLIINLHKNNVQNSKDIDPQGVQSQCDQMISDIQRNIIVYTQQIKFCMQNIQKTQVLIIKDNILSFQDSFEQIRILIEKEKKNIKRIIFSQNHSLSKQLFSQFVVELHKIEDLQEISFIQTVLQENAFNLLLNLVKIKKIKYIIIYKSYFLQNEIEILLNSQSQPINHNSYFLLDIKNKQSHQFLTKVLPNYDMLLSYENEPFKLSQNEIVYLNFQKLSEEKKNLVQFYIKNNLLDINSDISEEFINKYKDLIYDQVTNQIQDNIEQIIQNEDIEILIKQDDINILNFPILISILSSFKETYEIETLKKHYLKPISQLKSIKSNKNLIKFFDIKYFLNNSKQDGQQDIQDSQFKMNYEMFFDFYKCYKYNKQLLKGEIVQEKIKNIHPWVLLDPDFKCISQNVIQFQGNRALCFLNILNEINIKVIDQLKIGIDLSDLFMNNIQFDLTQFNKIVDNLVELHLEKFNFLFDMSFLNNVFEKSKFLELLNLSDMSLTNDRIKDISFSKIPKTLKIFNISENSAIQNLSFLNSLFAQCSKLEALGLRNTDLFFQQKFSTIQFQLIPESLEKIDLSFNQIQNQKQTQLDFINQIIRRCFKLTHVFLISCGLTNFNIAPINFELLKQNTNFAKFDIKGNKSFKGLNFLNGMLDNCPNFTSLQLVDMNLTISKIKSINFMNCRNLTQLNLSQNQNIDNFSFLNEIFYFAPKLTSLILQDVGFSQDKLTNLNIEQLGKQLTELDISQNKSFDAFEFLNAFFPLAIQLVELNLSDINLNDQQMQFIAFEAIESQNITSITLTKNPIRKNFVRVFQLLKKRDYKIFINFEYEKIDNQMFRKFLKISNTTFEKTLAYQNLLNDQQHVEAEAFLEREQRKYLQTQQELVQKQSSQNFYRSNGLQNEKEKRVQKLEPSFSQKKFLEEFIINQMQLTQKLEEEYMKGSISFYDFELDQATNGKWSTINFRNLKCLSGIDIYSCRKDCLKFLIKLDMTGFSCNQGSFQFMNYLFLYATQLKVLNLSRCELSDDDIQSINFKSNSLEELDLSFNDQIQDFSFLNKLLQSCQKLKVLKLQDMDLNDEKISSVDFKYLRFTKLKILDFSYNYSIQDFDFLNRILDHAPHLEELLFQDIDIVDQQINQILFYKLKYTNLKKFVLSQNDQLTNYFFLNLIINYSPQLDHILISYQDIYKDLNYYLQKQECALQNTHAVSQSPDQKFQETSTSQITPFQNSPQMQSSMTQFNQYSNKKVDHLLLSKYMSQDQKQNQLKEYSESNLDLQKKTSFNSLIVSRFQQDQSLSAYLNKHQESNYIEQFNESNYFQQTNNNFFQQNQAYSSNNVNINQNNIQQLQNQYYQNNQQSFNNSQIIQEKQFEESINRMNQDIYDLLSSDQLGFSRRRVSQGFIKNNAEETKQLKEAELEQNNIIEREQSPQEDKAQEINSQNQINNERKLSYQSKSSLKQNLNKSQIEDSFRQSQNVKWADQSQQEIQKEDIKNNQIESNKINCSDQIIQSEATSKSNNTTQIQQQNKQKLDLNKNYMHQPLITTNQESNKGSNQQKSGSLQQKILENYLKDKQSPEQRNNTEEFCNSQNTIANNISPDKQNNHEKNQYNSPQAIKQSSPKQNQLQTPSKNKSQSPKSDAKNSPKLNLKNSPKIEKNSPQSNKKSSPQSDRKISSQNDQKHSPSNNNNNKINSQTNKQNSPKLDKNKKTQEEKKQHILVDKKNKQMKQEKQENYKDQSNLIDNKNEVIQNQSIVQENDNQDGSYQIVNMNDMQVIVSSQEMQKSEFLDCKQGENNQFQTDSKLISQEFDDLKCYQNTFNLQQFLSNQSPPQDANKNTHRLNQDDYSMPHKSRISLDIFNNPNNPKNTSNPVNQKVQLRDKKRKVFLERGEIAPQVQSSQPKSIKQNDVKLQKTNLQQLQQASQQDSTSDQLPQENSVYIQQKKKEKKHSKKIQQRQKVIKTPYAFLKDVFQKSQQLYNKIEKEVEDKGTTCLQSKKQNKIKLIDFNQEVNNRNKHQKSVNSKKQDIFYSDYYNQGDFNQSSLDYYNNNSGNYNYGQVGYNQQQIEQQTPQKNIKKPIQSNKKSEVKNQNQAELNFAEEFEQMIIDNQKWQKIQQQKQKEEQQNKIFQNNLRYQEQQIVNSPYRNYFLQENNIQRPYQSSSQFNQRDYTQINFIKPRSQQQNRTNQNRLVQEAQPHFLAELSQKKSQLNNKSLYDNLVQENLIQIQNQIETLQGTQNQQFYKSKPSATNNSVQIEQNKIIQNDIQASNQSIEQNKKQIQLNLLDSKSSSYHIQQKQFAESSQSIGKDSLLNHTNLNKLDYQQNNLNINKNSILVNLENYSLKNKTIQQDDNIQQNDSPTQEHQKYLKIGDLLDITQQNPLEKQNKPKNDDKQSKQHIIQQKIQNDFQTPLNGDISASQKEILNQKNKQVQNQNQQRYNDSVYNNSDVIFLEYQADINSNTISQQLLQINEDDNHQNQFVKIQIKDKEQNQSLQQQNSSSENNQQGLVHNLQNIQNSQQKGVQEQDLQDKQQDNGFLVQKEDNSNTDVLISEIKDKQQENSLLIQKEDGDKNNNQQILTNNHSNQKNESINEINNFEIKQQYNSLENKNKNLSEQPNQKQIIHSVLSKPSEIANPYLTQEIEFGQKDLQQKCKDNQQTLQEFTQVEFTQANENSVLYQKNLDMSQIDNDQSNILIIQADEQDQINDVTEVKFDQDNLINTSEIYQMKNQYQELEEKIIEIQQQDQKEDEMSDSQQNFDNFQKQLQKFQEDEDEYLQYLQQEQELNFKSIKNSQTEVIELCSLKGDLVQEIIEQIMYNASNSLKVLKLEDLDLSNFRDIDPSKSKLDLLELSLKKTIIPNLDFLNIIAGQCNKDLIRLNIQDLEIAQKKVTSNLQLKIFQQLQELSVSGKSTPQIFQNYSYFNLILNKCQCLKKLTIVNSHLDFQNIKIIHYKSLQELDFSYNSKIQVNFLNDLIKNSKNLIHLKLNGIQLTNEKANQLNFSNISGQLQTISFADNPLDFSDSQQLSFLKELVKYTKNSLQYFVIDHVFTQPYHILQRLCVEEDTIEISEQEKIQQDLNIQKETGKQKKIKYRTLVEFISRNQLSSPQLYLKLNETFEDNVIDIIFKDRSTCENIILNDLICGSIIQTQDFYLQNRNLKQNLLIFSPLEIRFQMINFKRRLTLNMLSKFTSEGQNNAYSTIFLGNNPQNYEVRQDSLQMISNCHDYILGFSPQKNEIFETFYKQFVNKQDCTYYSLYQAFSSNLYSQLKRVYLPLNLSLNLNKKQMSEVQVIQMLNFMPPQQLIIKERVSNQLLKCWYCINYLSPLTIKSKMKFQQDEEQVTLIKKQQFWYEKSIANYFIEYYYNRNTSKAQGPLEVVKKYLLYFLYLFFNALSSAQKPFLFDFTVIEFNNKLEYNSQNEAMLFILYIIYLLIIVACITLFNMIGLQYQSNISQISINSINHIIFIIYQIVIFFIDLTIVNSFKHSLKTISQRSMSFHKFKYLSVEMSFYIIQMRSLLYAQIIAFSFYFNFCFITIVIIANNKTYIILAALFFCLSMLIDLFSVFHLMTKLWFSNKKYQLCTEKIDKLIILTQITNLIASNNFIREYSPSNYIQICKKLIDKTVLSEQLQLVFYSLPQTILQLIFYKGQEGQKNNVIEASIAFNFIQLILSLIHVLSYNPTQVNQEMFDELNQKKKNELLNIYEAKLFDMQKYLIKKQYHDNLKYIRFSQQKKREELLKLGSNRIIYKQYFEQDQEKYQDLMNEIQYNLDITQYFEQ